MRTAPEVLNDQPHSPSTATRDYYLEVVDMRRERTPRGTPAAGIEAQRFPAGVRVGAGSRIEDDVLLGAEAGRSRRASGLEIGRDALIRRGTAVHEGVRAGERLETGRNVVIEEDTSIGD